MRVRSWGVVTVLFLGVHARAEELTWPALSAESPVEISDSLSYQRIEDSPDLAALHAIAFWQRQGFPTTVSKAGRCTAVSVFDTRRSSQRTLVLCRQDGEVVAFRIR